MNSGYKIKNGGLGKVMPIHIAQVILSTHAVISNTNLKGQD
jgi:hypothetical protein